VCCETALLLHSAISQKAYHIHVCRRENLKSHSAVRVSIGLRPTARQRRKYKDIGKTDVGEIGLKAEGDCNLIRVVSSTGILYKSTDRHFIA
jgi:hypothetical protein